MTSPTVTVRSLRPCCEETAVVVLLLLLAATVSPNRINNSTFVKHRCCVIEAAKVLSKAMVVAGHQVGLFWRSRFLRLSMPPV